MAIQLGVLLSGSGTTLQNLIDRIGDDSLDAEIACVISSRADAFGLERARSHTIPAVLVERASYATSAAFNGALWKALSTHGIDLVILAGFMSMIQVPKEFENRIMNIHPALVPAFCGKGLYGRHVHEAVIAYGAKITGATVHFVDEEYDHGPIIMQAAVPVYDTDTPETLAHRVQATEREIYPQAISLYAQDRLKVEGRLVRIV